MRRLHATLRLRLRPWLADLAGGRLDLPGRLQRHIDHCPRCQRRLGRYARAGLAMQLLKSQPHSMGLLLQANQRTMAFLQRAVRDLPAAQKLQTQLPRASLSMRLANFAQSTFSAAACLLVLLAVRANILTSVHQVEQASVDTVNHLHGYIDEYSQTTPPGHTKS